MISPGVKYIKSILTVVREVRSSSQRLITLSTLAGQYQIFNKKACYSLKSNYSCNKLKEKEIGGEQIEMERGKLEEGAGGM